MAKTLEQAIGCWTVTPEYNGLPELAKLVSSSARDCRRATKANNPERLASELDLLAKRLRTMTQTTEDAIRRLERIILDGELKEGWEPCQTEN